MRNKSMGNEPLFGLTQCHMQEDFVHCDCVSCHDMDYSCNRPMFLRVSFFTSCMSCYYMDYRPVLLLHGLQTCVAITWITDLCCLECRILYEAYSDQKQFGSSVPVTGQVQSTLQYNVIFPPQSHRSLISLQASFHISQYGAHTENLEGESAVLGREHTMPPGLDYKRRTLHNYNTFTCCLMSCSPAMHCRVHSLMEQRLCTSLTRLHEKGRG